MHKPFLSFLGLFSLLATTSVQAANAPASIVGKKLVVNHQSSDGESGVHTVIVDSDTKFWVISNDDGEWEFSTYEWKPSGNTATYKIIWDAKEYVEINMIFSSSSLGTFTSKSWEPNDSGQVVLESEGTGTFTISTPLESELPPFDRYFDDDFSDQTASRSNWPKGHNESPIDDYGNNVGLTVKQNQGTYSLTGTFISDPDERWINFGATSLLPLTKDWVIQGEVFNHSDRSTTPHSAVKLGIMVERTGIQYFELSIGVTSWGPEASLYFDADGQYQSSNALFDQRDSNCRLVHEQSNNTIKCEIQEGST